MLLLLLVQLYVLLLIVFDPPSWKLEKVAVGGCQLLLATAAVLDCC
jgi:hypothetical protein